MTILIKCVVMTTVCVSYVSVRASQLNSTGLAPFHHVELDLGGANIAVRFLATSSNLGKSALSL